MYGITIFFRRRNMKINSPAEDRIIVELTKQDMIELDITYEDMDYSTVETRRVIWTLLGEAGKALGRELDPSRRMIIEALPKSEGGCVLCFTLLDARRKSPIRKQLLKKAGKSVLCEFDCPDALLCAAESFLKLGYSAESSLYESGGKYRLIVSCPEAPLAPSGFFSEFAKIRECDDMICEFTREHWRELAAHDALEALCGA